MNELYDVLKTSKASDFLIREEQTESREAFFIGQKLDMSLSLIHISEPTRP